MADFPSRWQFTVATALAPLGASLAFFAIEMARWQFGLIEDRGNIMGRSFGGSFLAGIVAFIWMLTAGWLLVWLSRRRGWLTSWHYLALGLAAGGLPFASIWSMVLGGQLWDQNWFAFKNNIDEAALWVARGGLGGMLSGWLFWNLSWRHHRPLS